MKLPKILQPSLKKLQRALKSIIKLLSKSKTWNIIAVIGALSAVFVAGWQLKAFIEFNKLTTKPRIAIEYDQDSYSSTLKATNMGGVAILHGVQVQDTKGNYFKDWRTVSNFISENDNTFQSCGDFVESYPFAENKQRTLLSVVGHSINKKMPISVSMCYCSVYDDCWTTTFLKRVPNNSGETETLVGEISEISSCKSFVSSAPLVSCNANE